MNRVSGYEVMTEKRGQQMSWWERTFLAGATRLENEDDLKEEMGRDVTLAGCLSPCPWVLERELRAVPAADRRTSQK